MLDPFHKASANVKTAGGSADAPPGHPSTWSLEDFDVSTALEFSSIASRSYFKAIEAVAEALEEWDRPQGITSGWQVLKGKWQACFSPSGNKLIKAGYIAEWDPADSFTPAQKANLSYCRK
ncbi:hypothetical protein WJX73_001895 [Symbiochloris irregularis]|uniref:Uncharacterized protein n=1 Tax=Symbiochloris irregularis TaxID=706552 RepID=A0AAW1PQ45_9CHLO